MNLDLFPLPLVLFPRSSLPLHIFEPRYLEMIDRCVNEQLPFGVILLKSGQAEGEGPVEIHRVGTTAYVVAAKKRDDGRLDIQVEGRDRFEVIEVVKSQPRIIAQVRLLEWDVSGAADATKLVTPLSERFRDYLNLLLGLTGQWVRTMELPHSPLALAQFISAGLQAPNEIRQELLEETDLARLLRRELEVVETDIPKLKAALSARGRHRTN